MTERGLPLQDGAPACPFVAFDDERDERSSSPDHRHRCYAESPPAPRALAHQEAYCLSSAFPVCPTFQDWARREAARAREEKARADEAAAAAAGGMTAGAAGVAGLSDTTGGAGLGDTTGGASDAADEWRAPVSPGEDDRSSRNPPRSWAAPPPWATGGAGPVEGRGLAGSAADRLAGGPSEPPPRPGRATSSPSQEPDEELAGLVRGRRETYEAEDPRYAPPPRPTRRPAVSSTRERRSVERGPTWEEPRRYEAYPTIKTRVGFPGVPRLAAMAAALVIAAVALFFLPALLGIGDDRGAVASPSPTEQGVATPIPAPTEPPAPTPQVYIVRSGDTLSKIAREFGVSLDDLLEANKATITDPNRIAVGDQLIIPTAPPEEFEDPDAQEPDEP